MEDGGGDAPNLLARGRHVDNLLERRALKALGIEAWEGEREVVPLVAARCERREHLLAALAVEGVLRGAAVVHEACNRFAVTSHERDVIVRPRQLAAEL